jgi:predicted metal-dependent peptidase
VWGSGAAPDRSTTGGIMSNQYIDYEEFLAISRRLDSYYGIFSKFWQMGNPRFVDGEEKEKIKTAAVQFDKIGRCVDFMINEDFWNGLSDDQKTFVVAHECLHVFFYHGSRAKNIKNGQGYRLANLAMDVVVNHYICKHLDLDRKAIDPDNKFCWADTLIPDVSMPEGKSFEFYFGEIMKNAKIVPNDASSMDDHSGLDSFDSGEFEDYMKDNIKEGERKEAESSKMGEEIKKSLSDLQKDAPDSPKAGEGTKGNWLTVPKPKRIFKKKWETIIKEWCQNNMTHAVKEQWVKESRRMGSMPKSVFIHSDQETDEYEKEKIDVWFFQDTSGSCVDYVDRFFKAAASIPPWKFNIRLFCFDTKIYETSLKDPKAYGFGGTSFDIIEDFIQKEVRGGKRYPSAVWIITDGYGNAVKPERPKNWYWFLTERGSKEYIDKKSKCYDLANFE